DQEILLLCCTGSTAHTPTALKAAFVWTVQRGFRKAPLLAVYVALRRAFPELAPPSVSGAAQDLAVLTRWAAARGSLQSILAMFAQGGAPANIATEESDTLLRVTRLGADEPKWLAGLLQVIDEQQPRDATLLPFHTPCGAIFLLLPLLSSSPELLH